MKDPLADYQ